MISLENPFVFRVTLFHLHLSGIQALIALMGESSYYISDLKLSIDLYTIPAFLLVVLSVLNAVLIFYFVSKFAINCNCHVH